MAVVVDVKFVDDVTRLSHFFTQHLSLHHILLMLQFSTSIWLRTQQSQTNELLHSLHSIVHLIR